MSQRLAPPQQFPKRLSADEIIELYLKAGRLKGRNLDYEFKLVFHVIEGTILRHHTMIIGAQECDLRIHPYLVRETGKGKRLVADMGKNIAMKVGIKWDEITDSTDAGLIGSMEKTDGGYIANPGALYEADILVYREGASIRNISRTRHSSDIMNKINESIEEPCPRHIHKHMAHGDIDYDTSASWLITTYPITVTGREEQTGFYQRFLFSFKLSSLEEALDTAVWLLENVGTDYRKEMEQYLEPVIERLKEMKRRIEQRKFEFDWSGVSKELKEASEQLKESFRLLSDEDRAKKFVERKTIQLLKLACHHAALDLREKVTKEDIDYALEIVKQSIAELNEYFAVFSGNVEYNKVLKYVMRLFDEGKTEVALRTIQRAIKGVDAWKIVHKLEREGRIEIIRKSTAGRPKYIIKIVDIYLKD